MFFNLKGKKMIEVLFKLRAVQIFLFNKAPWVAALDTGCQVSKRAAF